MRVFLVAVIALICLCGPVCPAEQASIPDLKLEKTLVLPLDEGAERTSVQVFGSLFQPTAYTQRRDRDYELLIVKNDSKETQRRISGNFRTASRNGRFVASYSDLMIPSDGGTYGTYTVMEIPDGQGWNVRLPGCQTMISDDGKVVVFFRGYALMGPYLLAFYDPSRKQLKMVQSEERHSAKAALAPSGAFLVVSDLCDKSNSRVTLYGHSGEELYKSESAPGYPFDLAISPDELTILATFWDHEHHPEDSRTYVLDRKLLTISRGKGPLRFALSCDGSRFASHSSFAIELYETQGVKKLWEQQIDRLWPQDGGQREIRGIACAKSGRAVASFVADLTKGRHAVIDRAVALFDPAGRLLAKHSFGPDKHFDSRLEFSADGKRLAVLVGGNEIYYFTVP